jgi:hypothetical protein
MNRLFILTMVIFSFSCTRINGGEQTDFELKKAKAFSYCKGNELDTNVCILINMDVHSGKKRLFVLDFIADTLLLKGICAHGSCNGRNAPKKNGSAMQFSNVSNSYCSSLGKYKIGKRSWSNWVINVHYKLHSLDSSNSNAYKRIVVLHSYEGVPDYEVYPNRVMTSWGCPMVSDESMRYLDKMLKKRKKVLM